MTHRITEAFSIVVLLAGCHVAAADEAQKFLKHFSWWEGEWEVEMKVGDDIEKSSMAVERHDPACHVVKGAGISVWGYDPQLKTWVGAGFNSDGSRFLDVLEAPESETIRPGLMDKSKTEVWRPDGSRVVADTTWTYKDNNTAVIERTPRGDQAALKTVITCKRKN